MSDAHRPEPPPPIPPAPPGFTESGPSGNGARLPWEERSRLGFLESLIATVQLLFKDPMGAFGRLRADGDLLSPFLFAVLVGLVGQFFNQLWSVLFGAAFSSLLGDMGMGEMAFFGATSVLQVIIVLILTPFIVALTLFISSAIYHLVLMLLGAAEESPTGFEGTLKVASYASLAQLGGIVPVVGFLITLGLSIYWLTIGLSATHRTSQGKALIAVLIPFVLCCLCVFVAIGFGMLGLAGAAATAN